MESDDRALSRVRKSSETSLIRWSTAVRTSAPLGWNIHDVKVEIEHITLEEINAVVPNPRLNWFNRFYLIHQIDMSQTLNNFHVLLESWNLSDDLDSWSKCCHLSHDVNWTIVIKSPRTVVYIIGLLLQEGHDYSWKINRLDNCGIGSVFIGFWVWRAKTKLAHHVGLFTNPFNQPVHIPTFFHITSAVMCLLHYEFYTLC